MIPLKDNIPTSRPPLVTMVLIALNLLVYLKEITLPPQEFDSFIYRYGLIPLAFPGGIVVLPGDQSSLPYLTVLTSMFVHAGLFHVAGNMLYLWIFGNNVEDSMGRFRFVVFYLLSGIAAALAQTAVNPSSQIPMVGASGAVSAVLGAYLLLHPRAKVLTLVTLGWFIRLVELPALLVLGFWIVVQLGNSLFTFSSEGGVAWFAHIGGFVAGMVLIGLFKRPNVSWGFGGKTGRDF